SVVREGAAWAAPAQAVNEEHVRGLPAIEEARLKRKQGRWPIIPARFWLWTATALAVWGVFYYKKTQGEIESAKAKLFARQRAIVAELGPRFEPLRDQVERWITGSAEAYAGDLVDPELKGWDFRTQPGIYLRLRLADAIAAARIRKAAN